MRLQLCQVCDELGDEFVLLKVNFGDNKELVRILGVKVGRKVLRGGMQSLRCAESMLPGHR